MSNILELKNLKQSFVQGGKKLDILNGVDFVMKKNEVVGLVGPSGSGKSTLLQITGLLEKPKSGSIIVDGIDCFKLNDNELTKVRLNKIGFVYQYHHLLPEFSALENASIPKVIAGKSRKQAEEETSKLLNTVGLKDRKEHRPAELSGGEQQRVAIARALANDPVLLLADEPTGNLDPKTAENVFSILYDAVKKNNGAALIVTHNLEIAKKCDRYVLLKDGLLVEQ